MFKTRDNLAVKQTSSGKLKLLSQPTRSAETANLNLGSTSGSGSSLSVSTIGSSGRNNLDLFLTGIVNDNQKSTLRLFYKDIYKYDPIGGSAIDMGSTLPFSDFSLRGADEDKLEIFESSIERLDMKTKNSQIYANKEVYGEYVSTLVYNRQQKIFVDTLDHDLNTCTMQYLPFSSMEPIINVKNGADINRFLSSTEEHLVKMRKHIPQALIDSMTSGEYILDPLTTLYLARIGIDRQNPSSYFQRLLPIYMLEKTLLRGTLTEAAKRQRAFLHAVCGSEDWEPTAEELSEVTAMFQKADLDPLGPVISTRQGIELSESRIGGDFWKYTDIVDTTTALKYKALGISEGLITGESTYGTAEVNLSVYMERLKSERAAFTQTVYYNKLFPTIAAVNNFYQDGAKKNNDSHSKINDPSKLIIPIIHWHKSLEPINDDKVMEILEKLEEKGIPITLRTYAAAGGMDIEDYQKELADDYEYRKKFAEYAQKLQQLGVATGGDEDYGDEYQEESSLNPLAIKPRSILHRDFSNHGEEFATTVTGKKKSIVRQKVHSAKVHDIIIKANRALKDKSHYSSVVSKAKKKKLI